MLLDLALLIVVAAVVVTALLARYTNLPITALEILAGTLLVSAFAFDLPPAATSLTGIGSLLIVFLAGIETRWDFLRQNLRRALLLGVPGFAVPFAGLLAIFLGVLHAPLLISLVGATVLADTSISIVYSTLYQYSVAELPLGRLILAGTLVINLAEDTTITTASLLTGPGFLMTLVLLGALAAAAVTLPKVIHWLTPRTGATFSNLSTRLTLCSLLVLGTLSSLVGAPGILFVFLMGLLFSTYTDRAFVQDVQKFAFAFFVPFYFVAVGLHVELASVLANLPLLLGLVAAASALKVAGLWPAARSSLGPKLAPSAVVLMNTRLTSATVILLLALSLGMIPVEWYSLLISAVVILALGSAGLLRATPAFRSEASVREAFGAVSKRLGRCVRAPRGLGPHEAPARPGPSVAATGLPRVAGGTGLPSSVRRPSATSLSGGRNAHP